jgi:hypothetical protein
VVVAKCVLRLQVKRSSILVLYAYCGKFLLTFEETSSPPRFNVLIRDAFSFEALSQDTLPGGAVTLGLRVPTSMSVNLSKRMNEQK